MPLLDALFAFVVLLGVDAVAGMKARVLEPAVGALCFHLLSSFGEAPVSPPARAHPSLQHWLACAVLIVTIGAFFAEGRRLGPQRRGYDLRVARSRAAVRAMNELNDRTVLATLSGPLEDALIWNRPLSTELPSPALRLLPIQGWITQSPTYRDSLDELGRGRGFAGVAGEIGRHPEGYALLGERALLEKVLRWTLLAYSRRLRIQTLTHRGLPYFIFVGT
jgi:hypothetical protein